MSAIEIRCPHCETPVLLTAGQTIRCDACSRVFTAPLPDETIDLSPAVRPAMAAPVRQPVGPGVGGRTVLLILGAGAVIGAFLLAAVLAVGYVVYLQVNDAAKVTDSQPAPAAPPDVTTPPPEKKPSAVGPVLPPETAPPPTARAPDKPKPVADDPLARVKAATVHVRCDTVPGQIASGSGFFAGEPGHVLTNAPRGRPRGQEPPAGPVGRGGSDRTRTGTGGRLPARVVAADPDGDLALLRVDGRDLPPPLEFGRAADLKETQEVVIYGYPLGELLGHEITVTPTTVTSLRRERGEVSAVQVGGGMHPGNSGGPLADKAGRVVGVCVAGVRGTQIHFAIPAEKAERFLRARPGSGDSGPVADAAAGPRGTSRRSRPPRRPRRSSRPGSRPSPPCRSHRPS